MSEVLTLRRTVNAVAFSLLIASCTPDTAEPRDDTPIEDAVKEATDRIEESAEQAICYFSFLANGDVEISDAYGDCDEDGVLNKDDVVPGADDLADDDGDLILNNRDAHPGFNDANFDADMDGTPDYLDSFYGNDFGDEDLDGLANFIDPQPYTAPPANVIVAPLPQEYIQNPELASQLLVINSIRDRAYRVAAGLETADYDPYTADSDNDNEVDRFDPEPNDPYIDSKNDPYDPRNDEYWED